MLMRKTSEIAIHKFGLESHFYLGFVLYIFTIINRGVEFRAKPTNASNASNASNVGPLTISLFLSLRAIQFSP